MTFRKLGRPFRHTALLFSMLLLTPQLSYGETTVLVNFVGGGAANSVTAADFAVTNSAIDLNAPVNEVETSDSGDSFIGSNGSAVTVEIDGGSGSFTTSTGTYGNEPILDSYLFNTSETDFDTVTVSSLEEFSGQITVVLYGVGDRPDQETEFDVVYNGANLGIQETDFDGTFADTFVTYTFTKVAGVDSVEILFRNRGTGGRNGALNGFSISGGSGAPAQPAIRINTGGDQHTDASGNVFLSDRFFNGGRTGSTNDDVFIVGTGTNASNDADADDIIYQTNRFDDDLSYEIPVVSGVYNVRLHFAETFFTSENERVFDVSIEGVTLLDNFDIFGTRMNAFTPGHDASFVQDFFAVQVNDGFLSLDLDTQGPGGVNNALISAIEVLPILDANFVILPTNGGTIVAEGGNTDSIAIALTQPPASNVTVQIASGNEVNFSPSTVTFTPTNYSAPQTIVVTAIDDADEEGQQSVPVQLTSASSDPDYDGIVRTLTVIVIDDDLVPVEFDVRTLTGNVNNPTSGAFGPDGRLYVSNQGGLISAFTFDNDYNVTDTEVITTFNDQNDSGVILGITFNPFEEVAPGETATLYVTQTFLDRATPDYENGVVALSGPNHSVLTQIITGLPVSGFNHGINGMQFDGEGNLLIAVGGNTNTGVFDGVFGSDAPESPLTSAVLRAAISDPDFNGNVVYEFVNPLDPDLLELASDIGTAPDPNNQLFGNFVKVRDVPGEVEVETYAAGLRNSYDIVFTSLGHVFATDNGPNGIARDELNFVPEGAFLGHPSIPRGMIDPRQVLENAEYDADVPSTADYTAPLADIPSSVNGIDEYRSETFGGQLRGQLIAQRFNNVVFFFELDGAGTGLVNTNTFDDIADGLDILTGPGGVIFGIDRNQDRITIAEPVDNNVVTPTAYDIFPFRAPAVGGNQFVIGGTNFGNMNNTTVLIDGVAAQLISVEDNRIVGIVPTLTASTVLRDVTVTSNQVTSILASSFLPLGETALKGDADLDGDVDFADIPAFIAILQSGIFQAEADCDCNLVVNFADIPAFIAILSAQ